MLRNYNYDSEDLSQTQLYVSVSFTDWAFIDRAYSEGKQLSLTQIESHVIDCKVLCYVRESVGINIPYWNLALYAKTGFDFQVSGNGGAAEFSVPAEYFRAFLDHLQAQIKASP